MDKARRKVIRQIQTLIEESDLPPRLMSEVIYSEIVEPHINHWKDVALAVFRDPNKIIVDLRARNRRTT